ncbi:MAG: iron ABC transporter permease [Candidatus Nanopelagicales bacterium]|nr:iron ABC transporter permease [Candidatus Nanopelagicales bacterium]MDZ4249815.1 iron ABC transporter permease [Candidatus Nanopelagicales bacterium]
MITGQRAGRTLVALSVVTALVAVAPLVYLVVRVIDAGIPQAVAVLLRPLTLQTAATSVALVVVVVTACVIVGVPTAWLLTRCDLPLPAAWLGLMALPLAVPSYVAAYAWISQFPAMSGFWAASLVLTLVSLPYVVIPTAAALHSADAGLEEVARSLGRRPLSAFLSATFPQAWPATAAGALLVGLYVLSDFGAVAIFRVDAFTRVIYTSYRASFDRTSAAVLALVLVALALALVLVERRVRGAGRRWSVSSGASRPAERTRLTGAQRIAALAWLTTIAILALGVPAVSLVMRLAQGSRFPLQAGELVSAAISTIGVSALGAGVAVALAIPVGVLAARYRTPVSRTLETVSYAGHALPGVVVGLSLVFLTLNLFPGAYQTVITLAIAYAVLFLPKAIGGTRTAVAAVPPALEQTARTLGRGPWRAWTQTTLRLSLPGVAASGLLVLLTAMKELPATLMLRPTGLDTLATELWTRTSVAAYGSAAPYAIALIALAAIPAWLLSRTMTAAARQSLAGKAGPEPTDTDLALSTADV